MLRVYCVKSYSVCNTMKESSIRQKVEILSCRKSNVAILLDPQVPKMLQSTVVTRPQKKENNTTFLLGKELLSCCMSSACFPVGHHSTLVRKARACRQSSSQQRGVSTTIPVMERKLTRSAQLLHINNLTP